MKRWPGLLLALVVLLAAGLRAWHLDWGLPQVYEEATPLRIAWKMWGWEPHHQYDLNPHFFNYPTLTIYVQHLAQGLLYGFQKLTGQVATGLDYQAHFFLDPTDFYVLGRLIGVLFACGTVVVAFLLGMRMGGLWVGGVAALLLSLNVFHIASSQMIEVDVPVTGLIALALLAAVRITRAPTRGNYLWAGLAVGLAASAKYTGALSILALLAAHFLTGERRNLRALPWQNLLIALIAAALTFAATSPFVLLDFPSFWRDFTLERVHMREGHFGLMGESSFVFYTKALWSRLLGGPLFLLGCGGLILALIRKRRAGICVAAFLLPYFAMISTWTMHADRYALPMIPPMLLFASFGLWRGLHLIPAKRWTESARGYAMLALVLLLAVQAAAGIPNHLKRRSADPRTAAKQWIEKQVPAGAMIVLESHGPDLLDAASLWPLQEALRSNILATNPVFYAVQKLAMYQVQPEASAVFYDARLYDIADLVVTSSALRSRYEAEPTRFRHQVAFYEFLDRNFQLLVSFSPKEYGGAGPEVRIYRNPRHHEIFSDRADRLPLPRLDMEIAANTGEESLWYYTLGLNYETFGFVQRALEAYAAGFQCPRPSPSVYCNLVMGTVRGMIAQGEGDQVSEFLERSVANAPNARARQQLQQIFQR